MGGKGGPDTASLGALKRARLLGLEGRTQAAFFQHVKALLIHLVPYAHRMLVLGGTLKVTSADPLLSHRREQRPGVAVACPEVTG